MAEKISQIIHIFKIDSLVFSGAVSIETKDSSNKLLVGNHSTRLLNNSIVEDDSTYPTLVALSNIGKGKILLIGDCDIFQMEKVLTIHSTEM